jgi:hypothetical protein
MSRLPLGTIARDGVSEDSALFLKYKTVDPSLERSALDDPSL